MTARSHKTAKLIADYNKLVADVEAKQLEIMAIIRDRLGDMTPYQFSAASGINKGNLYALVSLGRWNTRVALEALDLLDSPISDEEVVFFLMIRRPPRSTPAP